MYVKYLSSNGLKSERFGFSWIRCEYYRTYIEIPHRVVFLETIQNLVAKLQMVDVQTYVFQLTWWRHQMETFSALLALCAGNSPVPVNSPHKGQWRGALMFFFYLRLNKRLSKQQWGWWFEMPSWSLWRHCNDSLELRLKHMNITRSIKDELGTYVTFWAKQKQPKFNFPLAVRCISWIFSLNIACAVALHSTNGMLLTHWGRTKWTLSWQKMLEFRFKFHRNFFLLTINRHWFRYWLGIG